jgi:hypothetical protein
MVRGVVDLWLPRRPPRQFNSTPKTVAKWIERFRAEGDDGPSGPLLSPSQTTPATVAAVEALRQRYTAKQIAAEAGYPRPPSVAFCGEWASTDSRAGAGGTGPALRAREASLFISISRNLDGLASGASDHRTTNRRSRPSPPHRL